MANVYLLANDNVVNLEDNDDFTFEEFYDAFHELLDDYKNLCFKNKELGKQNNSLIEEIENF